MGKSRNRNNNSSENANTTGNANSSSPDTVQDQSREQENSRNDQSSMDNTKASQQAITNMINISGNITTPVPSGLPIDVMGEQHSFPGVLSLGVASCYGTFSDRTDPINASANAQWSVMRRAQTGSKIYDAASMELVQIALADALAYLNMLKKAYGLVNSPSSFENRYYPIGIVESMGIDYSDLNKKKIWFCGELNSIVNEITTFMIPASVPVYARKANLFTNVYQEANNPKGQFYTYYPTHMYVFVPNETSGKWDHLEAMRTPFAFDTDTGHGTATAEKMIDFAWKMIRSLMWSEDINTVVGDVGRAFGISVVTATPCPTDYAVVPIIDESELETVQNSFVFGPDMLLKLGDIHYAKGVDDTVYSYLECESTVELQNVQAIDDGLLYAKRTAMLAPRLFNTASPALSSLDVVLRMRYSPVFEKWGGSNLNKFGIMTSGEIITIAQACAFEVMTLEEKMNIVDPRKGPGMHFEQIATLRNFKKGSGNQNLEFLDVFRHFAMLNHFDHAPHEFVRYEVSAGPEELAKGTPFFNAQEFATIDSNQLKAITNALMNYNFACPRV